MKKQKQFVVWSGGLKVMVDEDVFRVLMQDHWREEKRKERETRCRDDKGHRCKLCCRSCPLFRSGKPLSLERMIADGQEPGGYDDVLGHVLDNELYEALHNEIMRLDESNRQILLLFSEGQSESSIAAQVGLSQTAINRRKRKLFRQLRDKLKVYM